MNNNKVVNKTKSSDIGSEHLAKMLRDMEYDEDHTALSDKILEQISTFDMLMNGLCHLYKETPVGDEMKDDDLLVLYNGWMNLKKLIKQREESHTEVWKMFVTG